MTCGHCVGTVTKAVQALDPQARVTIDLPTHRVEVQSAAVGAEQLAAAIADAGYTPIPALPACEAASVHKASSSAAGGLSRSVNRL